MRIEPGQGAEQIDVPVIVGDVGVVLAHAEVNPGARLEGELEMSGQVKRDLGLEIEGIEAALVVAAPAIGFMLHTALQIELEKALLKDVGIKKKHRGFVA